MKKFLAIIFAAAICTTFAALAGCKDGGNSVSIDSITITAPTSTEIKAGEKFTLGYTILPEDKADEVNVEWQISDSTKLSYSSGEFTALTCGDVKVKAKVKGSSVTDEIDLKVIAPDGYAYYSGTGYSLVYPTLWNYSSAGGIDTWTEMFYNSSGGNNNMNVTSSQLNTAIFSASAQLFQQAMKTTFENLGYAITFEQPVTLQKTTYLGVQRLQVEYLYTLSIGQQSSTMRQSQVIFNNTKTNSTYTLTITYAAADYNASRVNTIISQFMPA